MNRQLLERELAEAREHVAKGKNHLTRQLGVIEELDRHGHDTTTARALLRTFEESQQMHARDVTRLESELDKLNGRDSPPGAA